MGNSPGKRPANVLLDGGFFGHESVANEGSFLGRHDRDVGKRRNVGLKACSVQISPLPPGGLTSLLKYLTGHMLRSGANPLTLDLAQALFLPSVVGWHAA